MYIGIPILGMREEGLLSAVTVFFCTILRMQKIFQRFLGRFELAPKNYAHHIGHAIDAAASPSLAFELICDLAGFSKI